MLSLGSIAATIVNTEAAFYSVKTRIRIGWSMFKDLVPSPLGAKSIFYPTCVPSGWLYGSETLPVKDEDVIR